MPRGGMRGHKSGHKGQKRHFTNPDELEAQKSREERERQWRQQKGELESDSEEESGSEDSESNSDEEEEEQTAKAKGVEGLIEVENPNRVVQKAKKVSQLDNLEATKPELSRREREELEKQAAKANYQRLHAQGKTDDAKADLARLALIRKQREDAAKKRDEERKSREAAAKAKSDSLNKALGKKKT